MFASIRWKVYAVFAVIHLGFGVGVQALFKLQETQALLNIPSPAIKHLWFALALMYSGFILGALFILMPAWPWIRRANNLANWRSWLIQELPTILALLPVLLGAVEILKAAWSEVRAHHSKGKLDFTHLTDVIQKLASEAEGLVESHKRFDEPSFFKSKSKRGNNRNAA